MRKRIEELKVGDLEKRKNRYSWGGTEVKEGKNHLMGTLEAGLCDVSLAAQCICGLSG